jgi:GGDEF domain-containing protein
VNLSLKSFVKESDTSDSHAESTLNCYRMTLRDLRSNLVLTSPDVKRSVQLGLDKLISAVSRKTTREILESTAASLTGLLVEYRESEEAHFEHEQLQIRQTITALEELVRIIASQDHASSASLNEVLAGLEDTLFEGDLLSIHRSLQEQIRKLRSCVETLAGDAQQREFGFETHLGSLRVSAERTNVDAAASEHGSSAISKLEEYLESRTIFSLIYLRVNHMNAIVKNWSPACRGALFSSMEHRLTVAAGRFEKVHTLGEGDFAIIVSSTLARASERAQQLRHLVSTSWPIELPFGTARIDVTCSVGTAEYSTGESLENLIARAEASLKSDLGSLPNPGE